VWDKDGSAIDLQASYLVANGNTTEQFTDMIKLIEGGDDTRKLIEELIVSPYAVKFAPDTFRIKSPILRPPNYKDTMCHEKHLIQAAKTFYKIAGRRH
jgi:hypothetical protein